MTKLFQFINNNLASLFISTLVTIVIFYINHIYSNKHVFNNMLKDKLENVYSYLRQYKKILNFDEYISSDNNINNLISKYGYLFSKDLYTRFEQIFELENSLLEYENEDTKIELKYLKKRTWKIICVDFDKLNKAYSKSYSKYNSIAFITIYDIISKIGIYIGFAIFTIIIIFGLSTKIESQQYSIPFIIFFILFLWGSLNLIIYTLSDFHKTILKPLLTILIKRWLNYRSNSEVPETAYYICKPCGCKVKLYRFSDFPKCVPPHSNIITRILGPRWIKDPNQN